MIEAEIEAKWGLNFFRTVPEVHHATTSGPSMTASASSLAALTFHDRCWPPRHAWDPGGSLPKIVK